MTTKDKILDAAEKRVRKTGFFETSFRDLSADVGIKSASVHYHFPTKTDLGEALVARYSDNFKTQLDKIDTSDMRSALDEFVALYAGALVLGESICLCAIMGAEAIGLPENVRTRIEAFFNMNRSWLKSLLKKNGVKATVESANLIIAALEGAMIVASASNDRALFDQVAKAAVGCIAEL